MNKKNIILTIVCMLITAGCASSTYEYMPPDDSFRMKTERLIPIAFSEFWDAYVSELSKSFFVINNIEKESRIINVSFRSSIPGVYLDCGYANRTFNNKSYHYEVANSSYYQLSGKALLLIWNIIRTTELEGRINIYMAPKGNQTLLSVNALYIWSVHVKGTATDNPAYQTASTLTLDISSGKEGEKEDSQGEKIRCRSKGVLEKTLLELVDVSKLES